MENTQWKLQIIFRTHVSYPADYKYWNVFSSFCFFLSFFPWGGGPRLQRNLCSSAEFFWNTSQLPFFGVCVVWRVRSRFQFKDDRFERLNVFKEFYGEWEWMFMWESHSRTLSYTWQDFVMFVESGFNMDFQMNVESIEQEVIRSTVQNALS